MKGTARGFTQEQHIKRTVNYGESEAIYKSILSPNSIFIVLTTQPCHGHSKSKAIVWLHQHTLARFIHRRRESWVLTGQKSATPSGPEKITHIPKFPYICFTLSALVILTVQTHRRIMYSTYTSIIFAACLSPFTQNPSLIGLALLIESNPSHQPWSKHIPFRCLRSQWTHKPP